MLKNHDIVYMAGHDYNMTDCKISTDHIASQLSIHNRILYVESIGLRKPRINKNDMGRIFKKAKRFFRLPRKINDSFYVISPLVIPFHHVPLVSKLNQMFLVLYVRAVCLFLGFRDPILFIFLPSMYGVVGRLKEVLSVYYCTDEHSQFPGVDRNSIKRMETEILRKVTLGFATSPQILKEKKKINPSFYLSMHGVDYDNFSKAQDPALTVPADIIHIKNPVIGYFGAIDKWMDLELIYNLVNLRSDWTFLFIGKRVVDISKFDGIPNIHFVGQRPFTTLPAYGKKFDVAIIPFLLNDLTKHVFPIKLKEYLAMGKPIVSSALPPVEEYDKTHPGLIGIGRGYNDFIDKIESALLNNTEYHIKSRQESVRKDTWEARAEDISGIIEKHLDDEH